MPDFKHAAELLNAGQVIVIPTDTIYGLVARADDQAAVARLYDLKNRENKPGTLIAASVEQLEQLGLKHRYLIAVQQFWPGAVSVVITCGDPALAHLYKDKYSLAVRIPDNAELRQLLEQTGPLLTSSANHPGQPAANTVAEAQKYFANEVETYIDGGDLSDHQPSTVIRIVDDAIEVLREGAVKIEPGGEV